MTAKEAIYELVGYQPVAATELVERHRLTCTFAAVSRHLGALHQEGLLARRWDGNMRFGRFLYFLPEASAAEAGAVKLVEAKPLSTDQGRVAASDA